MDAESGRIRFHVHGKFADSLQPREQVLSLSFLEASSCVCVKASYRDATDILNRLLGRTGSDTIKLRTLSDSMCRIGDEVSTILSNVTAKILLMYGFDDESGLPMDGVALSDSITSVAGSSTLEFDEAKIAAAISAVNEAREEKIPFLPKEIQIESAPSECVYVSIDDIGVKHPREAGRKKIYTPEQNVRIAEIRSSGKSIRETAREAGCSTGHVQDVLRSMKEKHGCMEIN